MLTAKLNLIFLLLLHLSGVVSGKENRTNDGIVMTLHHRKCGDGFVPMEAGSIHDHRVYQWLSKNRAWALKRGMTISGEGSLYARYDSLHYIKLLVGTAQKLFLVMDTGSNAVWAPCITSYSCSKCRIFLPRKSSSAARVKSADTKCKDLCGNANGEVWGQFYNQRTPNLCLVCNCNFYGACPAYSLRYGTGATTGYLLSGTMTLPLEGGATREIKNFGVGCSMVLAHQTSPGIAGFGRGGLL